MWASTTTRKSICPTSYLKRPKCCGNRAEAAADCADVLLRVRRSRMQLRYVQLRRMRNNPKRSKLVEEFIADVHAFGITRLQEGQTAGSFLQRIAPGQMHRQGDLRSFGLINWDIWAILRTF